VEDLQNKDWRQWSLLSLKLLAERAAEAEARQLAVESPSGVRSGGGSSAGH
jgi:hypothetical protein